ncbi:hypothetical protein CR513_41221, partial [Mucuna pruriens]
MISNTQQFGTKGTVTSRMVNEVSTIDNLRLENQLIELTSLVSVPLRVCGICTYVEHPTNMCPTLQETELDNGEAVGSIELGVESRVQQQARVVPLPFPTRTIPARKSETDGDLLKMFERVKINIPLLDVIKQIPKYAKFLKELCMHKRKKLKGGVEMGGVVSVLIKNEEVNIRSQQALPKKC